MGTREMIFILISVAVILVGAVNTSFQLYKMIELDARARGLKHPKFWGIFAMNGNNSSGLLMYLIGRRNYPILNMTEENRKEIEKRKKKAGIGLIFIVIGAIGAVIFISLM